MIMKSTFMYTYVNAHLLQKEVGVLSVLVGLSDLLENLFIYLVFFQLYGHVIYVSIILSYKRSHYTAKRQNDIINGVSLGFNHAVTNRTCQPPQKQTLTASPSIRDPGCRGLGHSYSFTLITVRKAGGETGCYTVWGGLSL